MLQNEKVEEAEKPEMNNMSLKHRLQDDMKAAMRAHDKAKLETIRFALSAIKQREIDDKIDTEDDKNVIPIIEKLIKQHRESITQYQNAERKDLADKELLELSILQAYMPEQLSEAEIDKIIREAIKTTQATSIRDMGKVMGIIKPKIQGQADMSAVSSKIKSILSSTT